MLGNFRRGSLTGLTSRPQKSPPRGCRGLIVRTVNDSIVNHSRRRRLSIARRSLVSLMLAVMSRGVSTPAGRSGRSVWVTRRPGRWPSRDRRCAGPGGRTWGSRSPERRRWSGHAPSCSAAGSSVIARARTVAFGRTLKGLAAPGADGGDIDGTHHTSPQHWASLNSSAATSMPRRCSRYWAKSSSFRSYAWAN